ncbi:ribbon-helix-helix domain-containing protein [Methylobacterium planeticum]|uniref:Antitoxin-like ribbon-helix-helix domain-containing protein n=1 Tax=Methylobacterium planeticum TaxID=2615211 RepID=A0A6N6MEV8_9HYPH|nr:ribbon-helix-helix domain-containing protein [Methylobacterium planeticum]KAB1068814.1 hypothetical protein F6X51_26225 [Methylobacterium planeticum]
MSTQKTRPTLDSLSSRFAKKDASAAPLAEATVTAAEEAPRSRAEKDTRVQILTRIDPAVRKKLKLIAVEQERTIQEICEEAIRDFVARHSR